MAAGDDSANKRRLRVLCSPALPMVLPGRRSRLPTPSIKSWSATFQRSGKVRVYRHALRTSFLIAVSALSFFCSQGSAAYDGIEVLSSESIAACAMNVARATNSSGRCYAAICRALHPLGVELSGAAAYQAKDLLLQDERFIPLAVYSVDQLRRGDIIVYEKSESHPYGHISVYEGGLLEASDHVAAITHTRSYGGATVFRLRQESTGFGTADFRGNDTLPPLAPPYRNSQDQSAVSSYLQPAKMSGAPTVSKRAARSLLKRMFHFLLDNL